MRAKSRNALVHIETGIAFQIRRDRIVDRRHNTTAAERSCGTGSRTVPVANDISSSVTRPDLHSPYDLNYSFPRLHIHLHTPLQGEGMIATERK
jgi:hypothetical protein